MEQCVALVDYDALAPDEISFRKGDIINITAKGSASGFWEGYRARPPAADRDDDATGPSRTASHGAPKKGLLASCFVSSNLRSTASATFCNKAVCLYTYTAAAPADDARADAEMSFSRGDVLTVLRPSASPGWWFGVNESARQRMRASLQRRAPAPVRPAAGADGYPPRAQDGGHPADGRDACHYSDDGAGDDLSDLADEQRAAVDAACGSGARPLLFPSNFVSCNIVQSLFAFTGRQAHELSCAVGDVILVHRRWNDGWWEGSLRGRRGIFPSNYTAPNISTTHPAFFCSRCKTIYDDSRALSLPLQHANSPPAERAAVVARHGGRGPAALSFAASSSASSPKAATGMAAEGSGNLWRACATCARAADVTTSMLNALAAYDAGELHPLDLFAFVNTSTEDRRTTQPRSGAAGARAERTTGASAVVGNATDHSSGSEGDGESMSHRSERHRRRHGQRTGEDDGRAGSDPVLLDAKDVADLSAGLVKS